MQENYNKLVATTGSIERSCFIPKQSHPYYNVGRQITDFMYVVGIFNPTTNNWLMGGSYKILQATSQTYMSIGDPVFYNVMDFRRLLIWPYLVDATGVLYMVYKATAPEISLAHIPQLPHSVGASLLEYLTTADLLEQNREFKKARTWLERAIVPNKGSNKSLLDQCKAEVSNLARMDREMVLEPYRWLFQGGQYVAAEWISNETPAGTIDGSNVTFTLAQVPNPTASLLLHYNGQMLFEGDDYSLSGQTITLSSPFVPSTGGESTDAMRAWYQVA